MYKHSSGPPWSQERATQFAQDNPKHTEWGVLLDTICVVDADDEAAVAQLEQLATNSVPELSYCPCQRTRKGMHYMFLRPEWADAEGYWDGARQVEGCAVDLKTRCSTGTRGMLVISPTPGKDWLPGRAPWEVKEIPVMPRALMERVAKPKGMKSASRAAGKSGFGMATTVVRDEEQGQMPEGMLRSVQRLMGKLGSMTSDDREKWMRVGMFLKSLGGGMELRAIFEEFSKKSSKYEAVESEKLWASLQYDSYQVTMGTMVRYAREAGMEVDMADLKGINEWLQMGRTQVQHEHNRTGMLTSSGMAQKLCAALAARFPTLRLDTAHFTAKERPCGKVEWEDQAAGVVGEVDSLDSFRNVWVTNNGDGSRLFMGPLHTEIKVKACLSDLHSGIPSAARFVFNQREEDMAELRSVTENVEAKILLHRPSQGDASFFSVQLPGRKEATVASSKKVSMLKQRVSEAVAAMDRGMQIFNLVVQDGLTVNVYNDDGRRSFEQLRDIVLQSASSGRLRKYGGRVMRPREGAPCAYETAEEFRQFLNETLEMHEAYHERPSMQRDLVEYLTNYNPPLMRDLVWDKSLVSFDNGVLELPGKSRQSQPLTFHSAGSEGFAQLISEGRVASHHVAGYYPTGEQAPPTPLFDRILLDQMSPGMVTMLKAFIGRLHFSVGQLDNWQVFPYLIGTGGTGKTIVQNVAAAGFSKATQATLTGNQEAIFGLDGKYDKYVLFGRDLPREMSKVLAQELLQSMVSGEDVCVPRKGLIAENVQWLVPLLFGSNHMPDYCDNGGQVSRRVAAFLFKNPITSPDETLMGRILEEELPSLLRQFIEAYLQMVHDHPGGDGFWKWCPEELKASKREVEVSTSFVRRFLSMTADDTEALTEGDCQRVFVQQRGGACTPLQDVGAAYAAYMQKNHKGQGRGEKLDAAAMIKAGFPVEKKNLCKACKKPASEGRCCAAYNSKARGQCLVVSGLALVREDVDYADASHEEEDELE